MISSCRHQPNSKLEVATQKLKMKSSSHQIFTAALLIAVILFNSVGAAAQEGGDIVGGASGDIAGGSSVFVFRVSRRKNHDRSAFRTATVTRTVQARIETRKQRIQQSRVTAQAQNARPRPTPPKQIGAQPVSMEKMQAAAVILRAAKLYLQQKDLDEAEKGFQEVRQIDATNVDAGIGLGAISVQRGDQFFEAQNFPKAVKQYVAAIEFDNLNADAYAGLGDAYDALGQSAEALTAYEKALELNPGLTALRAPLGTLYYGVGNYEKAEINLKQALALKPDDTRLQDLYGLVLYRLGRDGEAAKALEKAVATNRKNPTTYYYLGEVYDRLNRPAEAVAAYRSTLELDPKFTEAYYDLGVAYYNRGNYAEAAKNYEQAIALKGNYVDARLNLADTYRLMENYPKAINQYQVLILGFLPQMSEAEKARINEAEMYSKFGFCLNQNKEPKRAVEFLQKAAEKQPDAVNYTNLAGAYINDKNYSAAKQAAQEAVKRNPNFAAAHFNLGKAQAGLKDSAGAVESFNTALKLKKGWSDATANLGEVYEARSDWDKAAELYREAVKAEPNSVVLHYKLGIAELNRGERKAAERERDALLKIDANAAKNLDDKIKAEPTGKEKKKKKDKKDS